MLTGTSVGFGRHFKHGEIASQGDPLVELVAMQFMASFFAMLQVFFQSAFAAAKLNNHF